MNDVTRAAGLARAAGALTFVDAVHFAPHQPVDVRAIGCDFLACSAYKFYGPHVGIMFARENVLRSLDLPKLAPAPETAPERLETGTLNHEGIVGAAAAVEFLASLAIWRESRPARLASTFAGLHARGQALVRRLWDGLSDYRWGDAVRSSAHVGSDAHRRIYGRGQYRRTRWRSAWPRAPCSSPAATSTPRPW